MAMSAQHQQAAQQRIAGDVAPLTLRNAPERERWAVKDSEERNA